MVPIVPGSVINNKYRVERLTTSIIALTMLTIGILGGFLIAHLHESYLPTVQAMLDDSQDTSIPLDRVDETVLLPELRARETDTVEVSVVGVPENSLIYYNDILVSTNPFRTETKNRIVPIRVEAKGYRSYSVYIVPTEDIALRVKMKRKVSLSDNGKAKDGTIHVKNNPHTLSDVDDDGFPHPTEKGIDLEFIHGHNRSKISERFE